MRDGRRTARPRVVGRSAPSQHARKGDVDQWFNGPILLSPSESGPTGSRRDILWIVDVNCGAAVAFAPRFGVASQAGSSRQPALIRPPGVGCRVSASADIIDSGGLRHREIGGPMRQPISIPDSCDGCGACCLVVTAPPFLRRLNGESEEAWIRLRCERPDLVAEIVDAERLRRTEDLPSYGTPCHWYDPGGRRCRHHELRPHACRAFAVGGSDCLDARRRSGIG